jgi:hypothetical protein
MSTIRAQASRQVRRRARLVDVTERSTSDRTFFDIMGLSVPSTVRR